MEKKKCKKFLDDDNYVHCYICGDYRNMKSFAHRKSKVHQEKLAFKLRKIASHLSKKKEMTIVHSDDWPGRDTKRFCDFCGQSYAEHYAKGKYVVENLGCLYHHADFNHAMCVKAFLERNFSDEVAEKYCIQKKDLDSFLKKLPVAKTNYWKKMDILTKLMLRQIQSSEDQRKKLVTDELQMLRQIKSSEDQRKKLVTVELQLSKKKKMPIVHGADWPGRDTKCFCDFCGQSYAEHYAKGKYVVENLGCLYHHADFNHAMCVKAFLKRYFSDEVAEKYCIQKKHLDSFLKKLPVAKTNYLKKMEILNKLMLRHIKSSEDQKKKLVTEELQLNNKNKGNVKVPPWLDDVCDNSATENRTSVPVIGPTIDTWSKHGTNQKKESLSKNQVRTSFEHGIQGSSSCLPFYHGLWNQGQRKRKRLPIQHKWKKEKKSCF